MKTSVLKNTLFGNQVSQNKVLEIVYLLFRLHIGLSIAIGAGLSKVFHKINEKGDTSWDNLAVGVPDWFVKQVSEIGFTFISPELWANLAVYGEFIGGLLIALGLLTRISAAQLAFQFFVIAFIWFDEPAPIIGMYFQQTLFWAFVFVAIKGGGLFSLDYLLSKSVSLQKTVKPALTAVMVVFFSTSTRSQQTSRVSFTVSNSSARGISMDFKSYNNESRKTSGYGYQLSALGSHAVNLPSPVRVYVERNGKMELLCIVKAGDDGKHFSVNKKYEISREDWLQAANDEMNEKTAALEKAKEDKSMEQLAHEKGLKLVTITLKGASWFGKQTHVRYQLPWTNDNRLGFSTTLSKFSAKQLTLPVGTKVYQCSDMFWKKGVKFTEKLIVTIDEEKQNYSYSL